MKTIKTFLASVLATTVALASLGFGVMMVGFALVLGTVFALALRFGDKEMMKDTLHAGEEASAVEPGDDDVKDAAPT